MKVSLKQALSIGLMATIFLPGFLPVNAENDKASSVPAEKKDDKVTDKAASSEAKKPISVLGTKKELGPYSQVDARLVRLERRIVEDLASGRLTPDETAEFQKGIEHISETEAQFRQNHSKFTHWQNLRLHVLLDKLSAQLDRSEHDRDMASSDLQFTREDLWHRIDLAAKQGRLTPQEVADLKQRFNKISGLEAMLHQSQGKLTYLDKLMLCIEYDHLGRALSKAMSDRPLSLPDVKTASDGIEKRLAEGTKSGKISDAQAQEFKRKLSDLQAKEEAAKKSGGALEGDQIIGMGLELDDIANKIESIVESQDAVKEIDSRIRDLDHKIALALEEGSLNSMETLELKEDLDAIQAAKDKFAAAGPWKDEDQLALKLDLGRLEGRFERQLHGPSRLWSGLTIGVVHLSHRNKEALKAKRLSDEESKSLGSELRALNKKKWEFLKADGGMTCAQSLQLSQELQTLAAKLDKTMKDRDMDLPNVDALHQAIGNRLAESAISGKLSVGDTRSDLLELGDINSLKEKYRASDNDLSSREKFAIAFELERLSSKIEEQMHERAASYPGLDTRRSQLEALVDEGLSSGRLDAVTADFYKQKISENAKQEKQYRADSIGLTADKALELVTGLEHLWSELDLALREKAVSTSDIVSLEGAVEKKIRQGISYGLLSPAEAQSLRKTYDAVVEAFMAMRATDGGLSYGERLAYSYGFQRLNAYVERNLRSSAITLPDLEAHRAAVEQKLGNLLATGRLPVQESKDMKGMLDQIVISASDKRASGGGMSYQESLIVSMDIDHLDKRIEERAAALKSPLPDVDTIKTELGKKIEDAKSKGFVNATDYKSLKEDLERIEANEAAFRISDESLNYAEAMNLLIELQRLKGRLDAPKPAAKGDKKDAAKKDSAASDKKNASKKVSAVSDKKDTAKKDGAVSDKKDADGDKKDKAKN